MVFVPVALNYDRVLEDRILHKAAITGERRFRVRLTEAAGWVLRLMWQKARGRFRTFGNAAVCYGAPVSLRDFLTTQPGASTEALADLLMTRVRAAVPVLPVPLAAAALVRAGGASSLEALRPLTARLVDDARAQGATLHLPGGVNAALHTGLAALVHRGLVLRDEDALRIAPGQEGIVGYYAASAIQRLAEPDLPGGYCQTALELPEVTET